MASIKAILFNKYFLLFIIFTSIHFIRTTQSDVVQLIFILLIVLAGYKLIADLDIKDKKDST